MSAPLRRHETIARAVQVVDAARAEGRASLHEHEGYALLSHFGIASPAHVFVPADQSIAEDTLAPLPGRRVVVKAVAPGLLHKTEAGGVAIGPCTAEWVRTAAVDMQARVSGLAGWLLVEFVEHDVSPGGEVLACARLTSEFGPVATLAVGGTSAECLASVFRDDAAMAAVQLDVADVQRALEGTAVTRLLTQAARGLPPRVPRATLAGFVGSLQRLAAALPALGVLDCEMNPVVVRHGALVALDALVTLGALPASVPPRPLEKLGALLHPRSIAIIGVSDQLNPGRIVLRNVLRDGTPPDRVFVVKPGRSEIDGCRCVPSVSDLPEPVDLLVVAVSAAQAARVVEEAIERRSAESVIVIPGGFEEKDGTAGLATRMRVRLDAARRTAWRGPLLVGGNCLGVRSRPGHYDTLFIPEHKLASPSGPDGGIAVVAQSGAFAIARASRWAPVAPRYIVTLGNQLDATIGDVLVGLAGEPDVRVFGVYVEGFRPLDGARALEAVRTIAARGGSVVLYRAGRTPAGASATASHTASIAGDYRLTRTLFRQAGAIVAETTEEFDDLVLLAARMGGRRPHGRRLGAVSNAGFECVAIADWLGSLTLAPWTTATRDRLSAELARLRVGEVVDVHNPLDLTPMTNDEGYEVVVRTVLADPEVDVGVVACVPLTAALRTVPAGPGVPDDLHAPDGIVARLGHVWREGGVPWVAVVDAGATFDAMAAALAGEGIPVFRSADRALRALDRWVTASIATA